MPNSQTHDRSPPLSTMSGTLTSCLISSLVGPLGFCTSRTILLPWLPSDPASLAPLSPLDPWLGPGGGFPCTPLDAWVVAPPPWPPPFCALPPLVLFWTLPFAPVESPFFDCCWEAAELLDLDCWVAPCCCCEFLVCPDWEFVSSFPWASGSLFDASDWLLALFSDNAVLGAGETARHNFDALFQNWIYFKCGVIIKLLMSKQLATNGFMCLLSNKAKNFFLLCCPLPTDRKMRKNRVAFFFFFFF